MRWIMMTALALACGGCEVIRQPAGMIAMPTADWRRVVTSDDRTRLRDWRATFTSALEAARKSGHAGEIDREGVLLAPDAGLGGAEMPAGSYRCGVIKLGARSPGNLDYVSYPDFLCRVRPDQGLQRLSKLSGSQRYVGLMFPQDPVRKVFLGTLVLGDERRALQYGQDETRDIAGYVERIGPQRWRLIMPRPHFESQLDVMDLVPQSQSR